MLTQIYQHTPPSRVCFRVTLEGDRREYAGSKTGLTELLRGYGRKEERRETDGEALRAAEKIMNGDNYGGEREADEVTDSD